MRLADRARDLLYRALAHELAISGPQTIDGQLVDAADAQRWSLDLLYDPSITCPARGVSGNYQLACHLPSHTSETHYDRSIDKHWMRR